MKKFLSLVLALVMTMSLVTISAGAKDFNDAADVSYEEAVDVMSEIGVVDGDKAGNFNPTNGLTRGAAAKIICNLILGPTTAAELNADTNPFPDVDKDSVYAGYIAFCAKEGIVGGYADGNFKAANPLTGYAFMKMLLGALGYDADVEGYNEPNWSINVAKQAIGLGLNAGLVDEFNGSDYVTREEAMLYAFNTLKATMVDYESKATVNVNGASVVVAGSTAEEVEWIGHNNADGNVKNDDLVQFAEKYFAKLKGEPAEDAFGRPATAWVFNKKDVGTYVDYTLLAETYTTAVDGGDVYADLGTTACGYTFNYFLNGDYVAAIDEASDLNVTKKNSANMGDAAQGTLTEVYVNDETETVTVVVVETWLAQVATDYSEKNEVLKVNVYNKADGSYTVKTVELDNVANVADFEKEDWALVTIASGDVMSMTAPEVAEGVTITTYSTNDGTDTTTGTQLKKLTADGEKYDAAVKSFYDITYLTNYAPEQLDDSTFNLFLDVYGNVIGVEAVDVEDTFLFVVGYKVNTSVLTTVKDEASVIFTDGTMATVEVELGKMLDGSDMDYTDLSVPATGKQDLNTWFEYDMDGDVYVLNEVAQVKDTHTTDIDASHNTVSTAPNTDVKFGNSKSTFITVDLNDAGTRIVDVDTVTTGIKNTDIVVPLDKTVEGTFALYNTKNFITYAVVVGEDANSTDNFVYVISDTVVDKTYLGKDIGYVFTYDAIINGEVTTVQVLDDATGINTLKDHTLFKFTYDKDGYAKKVEIKDTNTAAADMTTSQYKVNGYMKLYSATAKSVILDGGALWLNDNNDNQKYIILDDECNFFVNIDTNDVNDTEGYEEYVDAAAAISALGNNQYTGKLVALFDKDTGYATTVIFYDVAYTDGVVEEEEEIVEDGFSVSIDFNKHTITMVWDKEFDKTSAENKAMIEDVIYELMGNNGWAITSYAEDIEGAPASITVRATDMTSANNTVFPFAVSISRAQ